MGNPSKIRCIRLWTGEDQNSHFEEGWIQLGLQSKGDLLSGEFPVSKVSFHQTSSERSLDWHTAPVRQLVITLKGTLEFQTRGGAHFQLAPGAVLLAEDTAGGGHSWKILGDDPWCRMYVILAPDAIVPYFN